MTRSSEYVEIIRLDKIRLNQNLILNEIISNGSLNYALIKLRNKFPRLFIAISSLNIFKNMNPVLGSRYTLEIKGRKFKINHEYNISTLENSDIFTDLLNILLNMDEGNIFIRITPSFFSTSSDEKNREKLGFKVKINYEGRGIDNFLKIYFNRKVVKGRHSIFPKYPILIKEEISSFVPKNFKNFSYGKLTIGYSNNSGEIKADLDENAHILISGITGSGKSTLISNMILETLKRGNWKVIIIDPHGETAARLSSSVDKFGEISPFSINGINLISNINGGNIYKIAEDIVSILKSIRETQYSDQYFGPRMEDIIIRGIVETSKIEGNTLYDLYEVLRRKNQDSKSEKNDFIKELASLSDDELASSIRAIGRLVYDPMIRRLICSRNGRPLLEYMVNNFLILDFNRSILGLENSKILSNLFLVKLWQEIQSLNREEKFLIILEESQDYISEILFDIVSAGRKFGLHLVMVTTSLLSIEEDIRNKILSNIGNLIILKQSASDVNYLNKLFNISPDIIPQSNFEFLYTTGNNYILGKIKQLSPLPKEWKLKNIDYKNVELEDLRSNVKYLYNKLKSRGGITFIIPEFYLYFKYDRSEIVREVRNLISEDKNIILLKRIDVDFLGVKGRYQCYRFVGNVNEGINLDPIFIEFDSYLSSKLIESKNQVNEINKE